MKSNVSRKKVVNAVFVLFLVLLIIPQTRLPIQVTINRLFANFVTPTELVLKNQKLLSGEDWLLQDLNGNSLKFSDLEGKVILINFWATWCPPCIAEMPEFQELVDHFESDQNVVFLFITNDDKMAIERFMTKGDYSFDNYRSVSNTPAEIEVSTIPRTFIIGKDRRIIVDKTGAANWYSEAVVSIIEQALKGS